MNIFEENPVIAAVRSREEFDTAIESPVNNIFLLSCSIMDIKLYIDKANQKGKRIFVHLDMVDGLGKDAEALKFISRLSPYGIISTRGNTIKTAKQYELVTVQRFFMVDGQSVDTALESVKVNKPSYVEIMPGVIPKLIKRFHDNGIPVIAGGLISQENEAYDAINAGAIAISTSHRKFWI